MQLNGYLSRRVHANHRTTPRDLPDRCIARSGVPSAGPSPTTGGCYLRHPAGVPAKATASCAFRWINSRIKARLRRVSRGSQVEAPRRPVPRLWSLAVPRSQPSAERPLLKWAETRPTFTQRSDRADARPRGPPNVALPRASSIWARAALSVRLGGSPP